MSDERKKRSCGRIVGAVALLFVIYVLSEGPASGLWSRGYFGFDPESTERFNAIWTPASWVYDHCPIVRPFWVWYIRLWIDGP